MPVCTTHEGKFCVLHVCFLQLMRVDGAHTHTLQLFVLLQLDLEQGDLLIRMIFYSEKLFIGLRCTTLAAMQGGSFLGQDSQLMVLL